MNDDSGVSAFGKFIPGFDFLKNLASGQAAAGKGAASPLSGLGNWVAPTVSVEELDKRIKELKAVLFWLEQNATALKATVQALEVQKMTLATLAGMNMSMAEVAKAFTIPTAPDQPSNSGTSAPAAPAASPQPWPFGVTPPASTVSPPASEPEPELEPEEELEDELEEEPVQAPAPAPAARSKKAAATHEAQAPAVADPMQWWGALTQQFQQIAADALRDVASQEPLAKAAAKSAGTAPAPSAGKATNKPGIKKAVVKAKPPAAKKVAAKKPVAKKPVAKAPAAKKAAAGPAAGGWPLPPPSKRK
ncbi:PhaM family polyhydroxyalkanoate granule multifunctional regulatory protein [Ottowia thiooxydans]|uniref:PhaM family polyhydroxyalkanoate granule multifunctional regulatory protein n=1 Tax=Ottowia thiooxydans TaxID=219182 RepID=UPI000688F9F6|nr:PhaM family polyhydroxyalkanoate granule multifunctional regulatory protein [Ottowia thiooxydans]